MKLLPAVSLILLILISCKSPDKPIIISVDTNNIKSHIEIDNLISRESIIQLDFNEKYFIHKISRLRKNNNYIVVADFSSSKIIVVFDLNGKYMFHLDLAESSFTDFILTKDNYIHLWDAKYNFVQKYHINKYYLQKKEKFQIPFNIYSTYFEYLGDYRYLFINNIIPVNNNLFKYYIYDFGTNEIEREFGYGNINLSNLKKTTRKYSFHDYGKDLLISEAFNDSLLTINKESLDYYVKYIIDFKNNSKSKDFHNEAITSKYETSYKTNNFFYLDNSLIIDKNDYIFFYSRKSGIPFVNFFNKESSTIESGFNLFYKKYNITLPTSGAYNPDNNEIIWSFDYKDIQELNNSKNTKTHLYTNPALLIQNPIILIVKLKK